MQLKALFNKSWETVLGNCSTFIYLGGNDPATHAYVSRLLGSYTIEKGDRKKSSGAILRDVMSPEEVKSLDAKKCIIKIAGMEAVRDLKYMIYDKPEGQRMQTAEKYAYCASKKKAQKADT